MGLLLSSSEGWGNEEILPIAIVNFQEKGDRGLEKCKSDGDV